MDNRQTCILVLGMHRSGTSAITGVLELLGVDLGDDLMSADEGNLKGYFENKTFFELNRKLLSEIGSSWNDTFYHTSKLESVKDKDIAIIKQLIRSEFAISDIFSIKDPRLVFLFPVYARALEELNINIKILIPYRNPLEVAGSLKKRNGFSSERGMLLWAYHVVLAEKYTRNYKRIFFSFDKLLNNPSTVIHDISDKLDLNMNEIYKLKKDSISTFLEPNLKHHNITESSKVEKTPLIIKKILYHEDDYNSKNIEKIFDTLYDELFDYQKIFYNEDIMNKLQFLQTSNNTLTKDLKEIKKQRLDLSLKLEKKEKEIDNLKLIYGSKINNLQDKLRRLYNSNSWRVTKPLRLIVNSFKEKKINICLLVPGGKEKGESSTYIRLINPLTTSRMKKKVTINVFTKEFDYKNIRDYDVCIVQRYAVENHQKAIDIIDLLKSQSIPLIVDVDDAFGDTKRHIHSEYIQNISTILNLFMDNANMIWFSTKELSEFYKKESSILQYIIPNALDPKQWDREVKEKKKNKKIKFLYMGTSTHDDDFYGLLYPALTKLNKKYPNKFTVDIIGAIKKEPYDKWITIVNVPAKVAKSFLNYKEFLCWFKGFKEYDIGLSPLVDDDFNRCKTDIKFLDYLAINTLPVLSNVTAYNDPSIDRFALKVDNDKWFESLEELLLNPAIINEKKIGVEEYLWKERSLDKVSDQIYRNLRHVVK